MKLACTMPEEKLLQPVPSNYKPAARKAKVDAAPEQSTEQKSALKSALKEEPKEEPKEEQSQEKTVGED